jgi:hypothetical protein
MTCLNQTKMDKSYKIGVFTTAKTERKKDRERERQRERKTVITVLTTTFNP